MASVTLAQIIAATQQLSEQTPVNAVKQFLAETDDVTAFANWVTHFAPVIEPDLAPRWDKDKENDSETAVDPHHQLPIRQWLSQQIALIDELITEQLNAIIHTPAFQALESRWLSLYKLAHEAAPFPSIRLRLLNVSWSEVCKDISRAQDFDQSQLFQRIYNDEFGMPGGEPYGLLIGDYEVAHRPYPGHPHNDLEALQGLAQIAAASFAPFICSAAPELFGLDAFDTLGSHINLEAIFQQQEYIKWRSLRQSEDTRFVGLTLPRILVRLPHHYQAGDLPFKEECTDAEHYLWGNAAFALATVIIREFGNIGWFAQIRGFPREHVGGGMVTAYEALPMKAHSDKTHHIQTEVVITDTVERELNNLGMIALCDCYNIPLTVFQSNPSLHQPQVFKEKSATANARISAMLQQILCASRFAHYLKVIIRDKIGSYTSGKDCEILLQKWLNQYTTGRDDLSWEMRARYPLRDARLAVREMPGKPGHYSCVIHLKPHYIAENLISELKLTTELSQLNVRSGG